MKDSSFSRRNFVTSSIFGILAISGQPLSYASGFSQTSKEQSTNEPLFYRFPALDETHVREVVSAAHARFETVKQLVSRQPELANACWDWGFGDFETAIGAASHMGRRDIAMFLIENGARPDIFTFAMLGALDSLKAMIAAVPGVQRTPGPHGISLLNHAKHRLRHKNLTQQDRKNVEAVIQYLESLGDADPSPLSLEMSEEEKKIYLGEYRYGEGEDEIFEV